MQTNTVTTDSPAEASERGLPTPICSASLNDAITIARGCLDYGGGYRSSEALLDAFHHGIQTVVNALEALRNASETGKNDTQINTLRRMGNSLPNHQPTPNKPMNTKHIEDHANLLYSVYCEAVGGVAFNGDPLPSWEDFAADPNKKRQSDAWRSVAVQSLELENNTLDTVREQLQYAELAREWLESYEKRRLSVRDFRSWLTQRYGEGAINKGSLGTPLRKMAEAGELRVTREGKGRAPTIYEVVEPGLNMG